MQSENINLELNEQKQTEEEYKKQFIIHEIKAYDTL